MVTKKESSQNVRLYIAIEPPDDVKYNLINLQEFINDRTNHILETKSYSSDLLHITVQFIGDIDASLIPHYQTALKKFTAHIKPFDLTQNMNHATFEFYANRVAAFKLTDSEIMQDLVIKLREAFTVYQEAQLPFDTTYEHFEAHLSFGRTRQTNHPFFQTARIKPPPCTSFVVNRLILFKRFFQDDNRIEKVDFQLLGQ